MATDTITLGVQAGDPDAGNATEPYFMPLRKLLAKCCVGPYSKDIDEFAFVLRIDGRFSHWNFEGCEELAVNRRERYITVDIGVPESRWKNQAGESIAKYLLDCVAEGLRLMVETLQKVKLDIQADKLFVDFEIVRKEYLETVNQSRPC